MVSSGQVQSDYGSLSSVLSEYESKISSLDGCWKGASHDNFQAKASEFCSQFSSALESQMTSFATACDLYEKYTVAKENVEISKSNYNLAVSNDDAANASLYSRNISEFTEEMNSLKSQIESNLQAASSSSLGAGGGGSAGGSGKSVSGNGSSGKSSSKGKFTNYYQYNYNDPYGTSNGQNRTIAQSGCGPTSAAMVLTYLTGKEVTPVETANYSLEHGYRVDEGTTWDYFNAISDDYGVKCEQSNADANKIVEKLEKGETIITSMGPGHFTSAGHFIVLTDVDENGQITVADPGSEERSNQTWDKDLVASEAVQMWSFSE